MPWTTYGKQQVFATALTGILAPQLYLALFTGTANPAGTTTEVSAAGYARQEISFDLIVADHVANQVDTVFGPMAASQYLGVAVFDDPLAGNCWFWNDESGEITIAANSTVTFPAGQVAVLRST